jgi:hypothetical protein
VAAKYGQPIGQEAHAKRTDDSALPMSSDFLGQRFGRLKAKLRSNSLGSDRVGPMLDQVELCGANVVSCQSRAMATADYPSSGGEVDGSAPPWQIRISCVDFVQRNEANGREA